MHFVIPPVWIKHTMNSEVNMRETVGKRCEGRVDIDFDGADRGCRKAKQSSHRVFNNKTIRTLKMCAAHNNAV